MPSWYHYLILTAAGSWQTWTDQAAISNHPHNPATVEGFYTPPQPYRPPRLAASSNSYGTVRRFLKESVGNNVNLQEIEAEDYEDDDEDNIPARRLLISKPKLSPNDEVNIMPRLGWADPAEPIKKLNDPVDKSSEARTHRGEAFNNVGCAYVGVPCTSMYYPLSTYDKSHDSTKVRVFDGYWQQPGQPKDTTDYHWNILSSFPYIAKSPLFGTFDEHGRLEYNPHGRPFDDVATSPEIVTGKVTKVIFTGKNRVTSITFEYKGGASVTHGKQGEDKESVSLELADDEDIVQGSFSNCKVRQHTRLCGISLGTTKKRVISNGPLGEDVMRTKVPKGFVVAGFFGKKGNNIDLAGLVAIDFNARQAASKEYPMEQYDGSVWTNTQYPGIARSKVFGGLQGFRFNEAYMLPDNILQEKMNKLTLFGLKDRLTGMRFSYANGAEIDIGTVKNNPTVIDLGSSGRIEKITIQVRKVKKCRYRAKYCHYVRTYRTGGAIIDFTDKDGKKSLASLGNVSGKAPTQVFEIPKGTELVGAYGTKGDDVDSIGWVVRKSVPAA